ERLQPLTGKCNLHCRRSFSFGSGTHIDCGQPDSRRRWILDAKQEEAGFCWVSVAISHEALDITEVDCTGGHSKVPLEKAEPLANLRVGHCRSFQTLADARISFHVKSRQTRMGVLPNLSGQFVPTNIVLEPLLILGSVEDEPAGPGITYPVAEDE